MRRALAALAPLVAALLVAPAALADTQVAITSPVDGAHSLSGVVAVEVTASATSGVYGVQLNVDGVAVGAWDTTQVSAYRYSIPWDTTGVAAGTHTLTVMAMDWSVPFPDGNLTASAPVAVDVGPPYPTVSLLSPQPWTFVRGVTTVTADATSSVAPTTVTMSVDGTPLAVTGPPYRASWDTSGVADGQHVISVAVEDGRGKTATASATATVDNTPPAVSLTAPAAGTYALGSLAVQANASDASGIGGVGFTIDGAAVGLPVLQPDQGSPYLWSSVLSLAGLSTGAHVLRAVATDAAGNATTSAPVTFDVGDSPLSVAVASPSDWTFGRGTVSVAASVGGGKAPISATLVVDGKATSLIDPTAPYAFAWNTKTLADGGHTVAVTATDAGGSTATSPAIHVTVDNTAPTASVVAPAPNAYAKGTLLASGHASDAYGIASVQFQIDGVLVGTALLQPDSPGGYTYSQSLDIASLGNGPHRIAAVAVDNAGNRATSAAVSFTVGLAPPSAAVTIPPDWSFARATTPVTVTIAGGQPPFTAQLLVDGAALPVTLAVAPYVFQWNTAAYADGTHLVSARVVDALGRLALSAANHVTVDNTAPSGFWLAPAPNARIAGTVTLQAHASDANGVASVQFTTDGSSLGPPLLADSGTPYVYATAWDTTTVPPGTHSLSATIVDNAGNVTTLPPTAVTTGPMTYLPVLNYHGIDAAPADEYELTPAQADAQLAYLRANGYQSVTLAQYRTWLSSGALPAGVAKPVLLTVDDGLADQLAWDPLLQKYGFQAVLFVVTGFADNTTPGEDPADHMTWTQIQSLAGNGRWQIAFHAGQYGHGDFGQAGVAIALSGTQTQSYSASCFAYYDCLGTIKTTTTVRGKKTTTTAPETPAQLESQVQAEIAAGLAKLKQKVPSADTTAFACPWNACGQWTTLYNDPSGTIQSWLPGYLASVFPLVFMQTDPVAYGQASGTVGSLSGFNRHYRFEVRTDTTIDQLAAALTGPAFAR
jgi:hypothetical protein